MNPRPLRSLFFLIILGFLSRGLAGQPCVQDTTTLCLLGDRFSVKVSWANSSGSSHVLYLDQAAGKGRAVPLGNSDNSGYFWFQNDRGQKNAEVMAVIIDGCRVNNHFWVEITAPTDLGLQIEVSDLAVSEVRNYMNPAGVPFASVLDTSAFETCQVMKSSDSSFSGVASSRSEPAVPRLEEALQGIPGSCLADATTLCLQQDRFKVQMIGSQPNTGAFTADARSVEDSDESGIFLFFMSPSAVVQILDGRARDGYFWVNLSGLGGLDSRILVSDTWTGRNRIYEGGLPNFPTTLDNRAFGEVDPLIFPQVVIGDVSQETSFEVELGLVNPNPDHSVMVELEMFGAGLSRVDDLEIEILPSDPTGQPGGILNGPLQLGPLSGVTLALRLLPVPAGNEPRFVQGFMVARTVAPSSGEVLLQAPLAAFAYNLRGPGGLVIDRVPVAPTQTATSFELGVSRRAAFDTGIAIATPDGPAQVQVELFIDGGPLPAGSGPDSRLEAFPLTGHRTFFLDQIFDDLPQTYESALVVIRSLPPESPLGPTAAAAPIAVTALDVVTPPASSDLQIAAKEVRRN